MKRQRIAIIGAGLCGALLSALLRDRFDVHVIERRKSKRPVFDDIDCAGGEVNSSINRAQGLGGTTNYWHNALIEMTPADLRKAGISAPALAPYYAQAWKFFLSDDEWRECHRVEDINRQVVENGSRAGVGHMVLPRHRLNMWQRAHAQHPGARIQITYGTATEIVEGIGDAPGHVVVATGNGIIRVEADYFLICAGGLATPVLLSRSIGEESGFCSGYHDHPMAYVGKVRLRPDSWLKQVSCTTTGSAEVRAGLVYESGGVKSVIYLRPALDLDLRSISGAARFILSDLRNNPLSPRKILALLANLEAVREAILFKTKSGFRGDYYSILLLGEQDAIASRGIAVTRHQKPTLNWHVTAAERDAYHAGLASFLEDFSAEITETNQVAPEKWEFRTAAHHSGAAARFLTQPGELNLEFFSVKELRRSFVCDGSLLRAGGIANSGLTLVALSHRLADLLSELSLTEAAAQ
jgi:choline dehydrogenase-like flavoprotein